LLVGEVVLGADRRLRVQLAADFGRLDFLRVLRSRPAERIEDSGDLLRPLDAQGVPIPVQPPAAAAPPAQSTDP